jgi:2-C-methyl-D-erythritol 4-phosphate cytidylyltransferase
MPNPEPEPIRDAVALLNAAGSGIRLGLGPKAFLKLGGCTLVRMAAQTLTTCVEHALVGVPVDYVAAAREELKGLAEVFPGGATRQDTVRLLLLKSNEPIVVVHDVTRPFASPALIRGVIAAARLHGAAGAFVPSHVPAALCTDGLVTGYLHREQVLLPQSPQAYRREVLESAYRNAADKGLCEQTTWQLVLRDGGRLHPVSGEDRNIKITVPFDWELARLLVEPGRQRCDGGLE